MTPQQPSVCIATAAGPEDAAVLARRRGLAFLPAANLAWALVCFSRQVRGKFRDLERRRIALVLQQRLAPQPADLQELCEWLRVGLPEAWRYHDTTLAEYTGRLNREELLLAHQGAWSLARGSGRRSVPPEVAQAIENHFSRPPAMAGR